MAVTNFGENHPLAVKLWSRKTFTEALKQTSASKFMGDSQNSLIQVLPDTNKQSGDRIRFPLLKQLTGDGIGEDGTLEGNEEALSYLTDDILVNQVRHAVNTGGRMSKQRINPDVRENARMMLQDWYADRIDTAFFNQIAGNTAQTNTIFTGSNATVTFDTDHVVFPDSDTSEADVSSSSASSVMSLELIDFCVEKAQTLTTPIRPIKMGGEDYYVLFMHPFQATDLRTNTNTGQWLDIQKAAMQGGQVTKNPIFTGALGVYNKTILHVNDRVPLAPSLTDVRRAIFAGAQASVMAFGKENGQNKMTWVEEVFDYGNQLGVAVGMIWGLKKTQFNSADFGTITVPTYAVAHG
jgi:N4-gp56 family major capsid protein